MKIYGTIHRHEGRFVIDAHPQVRGRLKQLFRSCQASKGTITLADTRLNCQDLEMVLFRWPMESADSTPSYVEQRAEQSRKFAEELDLVVAGEGLGEVPTLLPLRSYQHIAVELLRKKGRLLIGDSLGLGKTAVGIGGYAAGLGPTIVVCQGHLTAQWKAQFLKFLGPGVKVYAQLTGKGTPPEHDVLILPYTMLSKWADRLLGYPYVIFDEVQELRRAETDKYKAAKVLADAADYVCALSATPVINYGDEIFNILDLVDPGCLGPRREFSDEWCVPRGGHLVVKDPVALGCYIAEQHLFLRRTRHDVGKQLPPINRLTVDVPFDASKLDRLKQQSLQLARAILSADTSFNEKGIASRQLDLVLRQQTGIMKAPFACDFIADLVDNGESVVLSAWHRECYEVLAAGFRAREIPFWQYTGSETASQKNTSATEFTKSKTPGVLMMSLRSGAGLDGLQLACSTVVHVELDWSIKIHEQLTGRVARDGQESEVTEVFLVAAGGSDPLVANILGLKEGQAQGITDPLLAATAAEADDTVVESRGVALAKQILRAHNASC